MTAEHPLRKKFEKLRRKPGPRPTWQKAAAVELGYSRSYISALTTGKRSSPAAMATLIAWRTRNRC